jgi:uncharacterized damage-inducible protein DinB
MNRLNTLQDLFRYHDWANRRVFQLSRGLSDAQLDQKFEMGFGSLRGTLFHLIAAAELWQDRFEGAAWMPLPIDPGGLSLDELERRWGAVADRRQSVLSAEASANYQRIVPYKNSQQVSFEHRLADLLLHVDNHAVHHRAQALNMLRAFGRRAPVGLDYLFYRLAQPTLVQSSEAVAEARKWNLECGLEESPAQAFDAELVRRYCKYGNWAMQRVYQAAEGLDEAALDRPFEMGSGSVRSTMAHLLEAERWWLHNWTVGPAAFARSAQGQSLADLQASWQATSERRDQWLAEQSPESLEGEVTAKVGDLPLRFRVGESVLQLCGHGTHHRAQLVNMLRHLGRSTEPLDYAAWMRTW